MAGKGEKRERESGRKRAARGGGAYLWKGALLREKRYIFSSAVRPSSSKQSSSEAAEEAEEGGESGF